MRSMTGFGKGVEQQNGNEITVEVSGTNRKHLDIRFSLPKEITGLEARLRPQVQEAANRGSVIVQIDHELSSEYRCEQIQLDTELAKKLVKDLKQLAEQTDLSAQVTLSDLLAVPGVVNERPERVPIDTLTPLASSALTQALEQFTRQKEEEGNRLAEDIRSRCDVIAAEVEKIHNSQQDILDEHRRKLEKRVREIADDTVAQDQERLTREAVYYAERSDINEEVTRLQSHITEMQNLLDAENQDSCGRQMDFICQEMHRELNTLGAKTSDSACASSALQAKAELASMREQVQNIE